MQKSSKKVPIIYSCEACDYNTSRKSQWSRHILTAKHLKLTNAASGLTKKVPCKFICEKCKKDFNHRQSLFRHKKICKNGHGQLAKLAKKLAKVSHQKFHCECGKSYKHASSLSKHKTKCIYLHVEDDKKDYTDEIVPTNNVEILLKCF